MESEALTTVRDDGHVSDDEGEGADDKKKKVKKRKKVCVINPETCFLNHPIMCVKTRFPSEKSDFTLCAGDRPHLSLIKY